MITSVRNPKIQRVRALQNRARLRRQEGAFVVEGVRLGEEALRSGWDAQLVLHTQDLEVRSQSLVSGFAARGTEVESVTDHVMAAASDTQTPQGLLVVLSLRPLPLPLIPTLVFIPDGVRDPGNLGGMLRSAAAAGAQAVLLPPGTTDPYSPKVVRAAMGAHFRLPVQPASWEEIRLYLKGCALKVFLADAAPGPPYTQVDLRSPLALIIGGEAAGAGAQALALAQARLHIPLQGEVESLNAAAAAAVLLFEIARQRRQPASLSKQNS